MDETSGNVSDASGNGLTLTNNGTTTFVGGKFGNGSEHVPASTQYFSTATTINNVKSVSFWTNPDNTTNYYINLTASANIQSAGTISTPGFTNPKVYVNGMQTNAVTADTWQLVTVTSDTAINADVFYVGRVSSSYHDGTLDEVRLYNRTLTPSEVVALYNWAPGPVGYWKFDEGTGSSAYDSSGNGNNGTLTGSPKWSAGKYGSAIATSDNGSNEYISVPDPSSGILDFPNTSDYTISAWIKGTNNDGAGVDVVSKNMNWDTGDDYAGYTLHTALSGGLFAIDCKYADGNGSGEEQVNGLIDPLENKWYYATCVMDRDGSETGTAGLHVYLNSTLYNSDTSLTEGSAANSANLMIGEGPLGTNDLHNASVDDVKIYNYARSPAQIVQDMNAGHPAPGSPIGSPALWWKFDEGADNTCADAANDACNSGSGGTTLDATRTGGDWDNNGKFGKAINMWGADDKVSAGDTAFTDSLTQMTISMWVYPDALTDSHDYISKWNTTSQNSFRVGVPAGGDPTDEIRVNIPSSLTNNNLYFQTTNFDLATSVWTHLTVVYDGTLAGTERVKVYKNAQIKNGSVANGPIPASLTSGSTSNLTLGDSDTSEAQPTFGSYDEVKIYTSALTADQIKVEYNQGSAAVMGASSTTSTGTASWSALDAYCPPGQGTACVGPVGEWKLDENGGNTAFDTSGNEYNGTLTNSPKWVPGKMGSGLAMKKNSVAEYVSVTSNDDLDFTDTESYTLSAWVQLDKIEDAEGYIINKNFSPALDTPGYVMRVGYGGEAVSVSCEYSDGGSSEDVAEWLGTTLEDGGWHHIACVMDRTAGELHTFVDGWSYVSTSDISLGESSAANAAAVTFGETTYPNEFTGKIDDIRIYNYARTPAQINWEASRGKPLYWFKFDECTGNVLHNSINSKIGNNPEIAPGAGTHTTTGSCNSGSASEMWDDGQTGKRNYSLDFDGVDDYAYLNSTDFGFDAYSGHNFSISGWFNRETYDTDDAIVTQRASLATNSDGGFVVYVDDATDKLVFEASDTTDAYQMESASTFTGTGWNHFVITWDDNSVANTNIYINGKKENVTRTGTLANIGDLSAGAVNFEIGGVYDATTAPFAGELDDIKIFTYALSPQQIATELNDAGALRFGPLEGAP